RFANGCLVDLQNAIDVFDSTDGAATDQVRGLDLAGRAVAFRQEMSQVRIQHVARDGRLAGPGDACYHDEASERDLNIRLADIVELNALQPEARSLGVDFAVRLGGMLQRVAEEFPGRRARVPDQVVDRPGAYDFATADSRLRPEVEDVIRTPDRLFI